MDEEEKPEEEKKETIGCCRGDRGEKRKESRKQILPESRMLRCRNQQVHQECRSRSNWGQVLDEQYLDSYGGDEGDDPPEVSAEELEQLDKAARDTEIERMIKMPAMVETDQAEAQQTEGYIISTKVVLCWKHRVEQGGWFRRARLVARQFRNSVELDATFAPTSIIAIPKLLIHYMLNVRREFVVVTLDINDAFLMAQQPLTENAFVQVDDRIFNLLRCLPGQRTAASQWFQLFATACREHGLEQDSMQPTLMFIRHLIYLKVNVDDVFIVGREDKVRDLARYFEEKQWNVEEKGPFSSFT